MAQTIYPGKAYFVPPRTATGSGENNLHIGTDDFFTTIGQGQLEALLLEHILTTRMVMDRLAERLGTIDPQQPTKTIPYNRA